MYAHAERSQMHDNCFLQKVKCHFVLTAGKIPPQLTRRELIYFMDMCPHAWLPERLTDRPTLPDRAFSQFESLKIRRSNSFMQSKSVGARILRLSKR